MRRWWSLIGNVMGTAAYIASEQARGMAVDRRADVWSFGVVLYEALSGRRAFEGEAIPETLSAVLNSDPDWSALPSDTAPPIRRLLCPCLERDRRRRLRDMGDAIIEIDEVLASADEQAARSFRPVTSKTAGTRSRVLLRALGLLAVALLITTVMLWRLSQPVGHPLIRLNVDLGPDVVTGTSTTVIISRDGRRLIFPAGRADGKQQLNTAS
jgi:serine/threonine-protein kinase